MNISTALQFDSITLPAWTATAIRYTRRAAVQTSIVIKAFNKAIAPVIATTAKDLSHYYWLCLQGAGEWAMSVAGITHNPVQAAVRAAYAELVFRRSNSQPIAASVISPARRRWMPWLWVCVESQQSQSVLMSFKKAIAQQPNFIALSTVASIPAYRNQNYCQA